MIFILECATIKLKKQDQMPSTNMQLHSIALFPNQDHIILSRFDTDLRFDIFYDLQFRVAKTHHNIKMAGHFSGKFYTYII